MGHLVFIPLRRRARHIPILRRRATAPASSRHACASLQPLPCPPAHRVRCYAVHPSYVLWRGTMDLTGRGFARWRAHLVGAAAGRRPALRAPCLRCSTALQSALCATPDPPWALVFPTSRFWGHWLVLAVCLLRAWPRAARVDTLAAPLTATACATLGMTPRTAYNSLPGDGLSYVVRCSHLHPKHSYWLVPAGSRSRVGTRTRRVLTSSSACPHFLHGLPMGLVPSGSRSRRGLAPRA